MKQTHIDALDAIKHLLEVDLNKVTWEQEQSAKAALQVEPSTWELISAVKTYARALADVCRSHSAKCAEIHADRGEQDSAMAAMGTLLFTLCAHLRLPDALIIFSAAKGWPESNAVRDFILWVADAPIELVDGELVVTPTLPRWEPKGSLGQRIAGGAPDPRQGQPAAFLSVEETERYLRELTESFRGALWERLRDSFSEAILATYKGPQGSGVLQPQKTTAQENGEKTASSSGEPTRKTPSNQSKERTDIHEVAPGVGLPLVDIRKPASIIGKETRRAALKKGAPYREVPDIDRILRAVEYRKTTGCTYAAASIEEFGDPNSAEKIRYWNNKRTRGEE
jgi:hypothetical protein